MPHDERLAAPDSRTVSTYRRQLLGGEPSLTSAEIADRAGVPLADFEEYWLAMGFPPPPPDEVFFTWEDLEAFEQWNELLREEHLDRATGLSLTRAQSHMADRLVLWQVEALVEDTGRRLGLDDTSARLVTIDEIIRRVPALEDQLEYAWRRQMEALLTRTAVEISQRPHDHSRRRFPLTRALGFVDMVSYTSSSELMGGRLVGLIELFEYLSRLAVTEKGGRVVKMIGDAVFFIADDLRAGLEVVTNLVDTLTANAELLPVRASLVEGDVFSRSGDVFGPPVNLASRLVDIAPTGQVLTDARTAAAIAAGKAGSGYRVVEFPSTRLRGFGRVSPYVVKWREEDGGAHPQP